MRSVDKDFVTVSLRSDGIVHVDFKNDTLITVELQYKLEEIYHSLVSDDHAFVFTGGEFVTITADARKNAIAMEDRVPVRSSAVVVKNLAQRIIADYYYRFNRPKRPYRVFKTFEQAIEWSLELNNKLSA